MEDFSDRWHLEEGRGCGKALQDNVKFYISTSVSLRLLVELVQCSFICGGLRCVVCQAMLQQCVPPWVRPFWFCDVLREAEGTKEGTTRHSA